MSRESKYILNVLRAISDLVVAGACDTQTAKDILSAALRIWTDKKVDKRYFGWQKSTGVLQFPDRPTTFDHAVPVRVLVRELVAKAPLNDLSGLELELRSYLRIVEVLKDEDAELRRKKPDRPSLKQRMPIGWSWGDPWNARYEAAGIRIAKERPA